MPVLTRKMAELKNELLQAISQMFTSFKEEQAKGLDKLLDEKLESKFTALDTKLDEKLDNKLTAFKDEHTKVLDAILEKKLDNKFKEQDNRLEEKFKDHIKQFDQAVDKLIDQKCDRKFKLITDRVDSNSKTLESLQESIDINVKQQVEQHVATFNTECKKLNSDIQTVRTEFLTELQPVKDLNVQWNGFRTDIEGKVQSITTDVLRNVQADRAINLTPDNLEHFQSSIQDQIMTQVMDRVKATHTAEINDIQKEISKLKQVSSGQLVNVQHSMNNLVKQFPTFRPDGKTHPILFLKAFEHCLPTDWDILRQIDFVVGYMEDEARDWGLSHLQDFSSWNDFTKAFKEKFWSKAAQEKLMNSLLNPPFYKKERGTMKAYMEVFLNQIKFLDEGPLVYEHQLVRILITRLPVHVQTQVFCKGWNSTAELLSVLETLDAFDKAQEERTARSARFTQSNGNGTTLASTSNTNTQGVTQSKGTNKVNGSNGKHDLGSKTYASTYIYDDKG